VILREDHRICRQGGKELGGMNIIIRGRRMPLLGSVLSALAVAALAAPNAAPAAPPAAPARAARPAVAAAASGQPAWLAAVRQRAVLHKRNGRFVTNGPDPRLSLVPDRRGGDVAGWARRRAEEAAAAQDAAGGAALRSATPRSAPKPRTRGRLAVTEREAAGTRGANDSLATAEKLRGFGTRKPLVNAVDLSGNQSAAELPPVEKLPPNVEDDGLPETARVTGVSTERGGFGTTGFIGDAPPTAEEPAREDVDFYALDLTAGELFDASLHVTSGNLIPLIFLVDENGNFLADSFFDPDLFDVDISVPIRSTGRYYLAAIGFFLISDDPAETGPTTGDYDLTLTARAGDVDTFAVPLAAGDVLGVSVADAGKLVTIYDAEGTELMGSSQDFTAILPANTPMPGGGNAAAETVAPKKGTYYVSVAGGDGPYTAMIEAYRPGGTGRVAQTVFLDYDGQRLNTGMFFGRGVTTLSPLSAFLGNWGLPSSARKALGRRIKATVQENIDADLRAAGLSDSVSVRVVTSDEVADPFGRKGVMRVVVGGTMEESGVFTIGIAQSIDPGNFDREETALVLLDSISEPGDLENAPYSLNSYLTPRSNKLAFVGRAVGNIVSHEVGHTLGSWHTDNSDARASLMDAGGNFALLYGVGPDEVGGTRDDADVDFVVDTFDLFEGFTGEEDTRARSVWALSR
jgi:hypothetical protein